MLNAMGPQQNDLLQSTKWLEKFLLLENHGLQLSDASFDPIRNYGLLWNLFESISKQTLQLPDEANEEEIVSRTVDAYLPENTTLDKVFFYFQRRYVVDGKTNWRFDNLWPQNRSREKRAKTEECICRNDASTPEKNYVCGLICLRLRSNLIHGRKDMFKIQEQAELFNSASLYLETMIDGLRR